MLRVFGLTSAPVASRSVLRAIVGAVLDEEVHWLQLRRVACDQGDSAGAESAHDGHGAGRCVGLGAVSGVGSSEQMLHHIRRRRTPGSTHFDAARP